MIKSVPDNKYSFFNPEQPWSDMFQKQPVEASLYQDEYTVFRVKETDPKHKLWFVMDNNLVLPEYLAEFEYVLKTPYQNKIADFGNVLGLLDNEDDEFISPQNISLYREQISNIYNTLADDINNYQFENLEDCPTYELKASDLERADINVLKPTLVNYFKYCLSRSNFYELNPNLVTESISLQTYQQSIAQGTKFINLSNCGIVDISNLQIIG